MILEKWAVLDWSVLVLGRCGSGPFWKYTNLFNLAHCLAELFRFKRNNIPRKRVPMDCSARGKYLWKSEVLAADDNHNFNVAENKYSRAINDLDVDADIKEISRLQAKTGSDKEYYVTQCGYGNLQRTDGPSIQVVGKSVVFEGATLKAAKLVHLLVKFMPRTLLLKIAEVNTVGLYSSNMLPDTVFAEFSDRPSVCAGRCGYQYQNNEVVDCSEWCTTPDYPYQSANCPLNYLWAYGNFLRMFVVETNVVCLGFNPTLTENLLIREFGYMLMARTFDEQTLADIEDAFNTANASATWSEMKNKYEYFMLGTLAWFNGAHSSSKSKGMACLNIFGNNGLPLCEDAFGQRQFIKERDIKLYKILNYIYITKIRKMSTLRHQCVAGNDASNVVEFTHSFTFILYTHTITLFKCAEIRYR